MTNMVMEGTIHPQQNDTEKVKQEFSQQPQAGNEPGDQLLQSSQTRNDVMNSNFQPADPMKAMYSNNQPMDNLTMMPQYQQGYNDSMAQRPMYMDQKVIPASSNNQPRFSQSGPVSSTPTPTLNHLLTQNTQAQKYPNSYGGDMNASAGGAGMGMSPNTPTMYDGWGNQNHNQQAMYQGHMNAMRPGMPPNSRQMGPNQMQVISITSITELDGLCFLQVGAHGSTDWSRGFPLSISCYYIIKHV